MTTISQERSRWAAVTGAPSIRRRESWGARFNYTTARSVEEPATRVFVHITVTNPKSYASNDAHARAVENIGISRFPATGISYNRLIMPDGSLYEGQPIGRRGAHTVNDFKRSTCSTSGCPGRGTSLTAPSWNLNINARSYVICQNVGDPVSDKQVDTIARAIVTDYRAGFITWSAAHNLHGHRCVSAKSCPGDRMWAQMGKLHDLIHHYHDKGLGGGTAPAPPPAPPREDTLSEEVVLSALRKFAKEQQSVTGLVADTLPTAWNKSLYYLAGYGATSASPVGRQRQAADVWSRVNPTLELQYGSIARFMLNAIRPDKSQTPGARVGILQDLDRIEETAKAALAAVQGLDETQILARIDEHHAEVTAQAEQADAALQQLAERVDEAAGQAQAERAAILALVEQVGAGELAAERALELVRERLGAAGAALGDEPA